MFISIVNKYFQNLLTIDSIEFHLVLQLSFRSSSQLKTLFYKEQNRKKYTNDIEILNLDLQHGYLITYREWFQKQFQTQKLG